MPNPIKLDEHIAADMGSHDLYKAILRPQTCFGEQLLERWTTQCTADAPFLKETQRLLRTELPRIEHDCGAVETIRQQLREDDSGENKDEEGFHAKYQYMDWGPLLFLNRSRSALQCMSLYNLASPILSLCVPIICLIIPFFVIRMRGIAITLTSYVEVLQVVLQKHQLGQLFAFSSATWDKRFYILLSAGFYVLSVYQNARSCARFYANMSTIHHELQVIRAHVDASLGYIRQFERCVAAAKCATYAPMGDALESVRARLVRYREKLDEISPTVWSKAKLFEIGHVMECFYELHQDGEVRALLDYTCDFCGYLDNLGAVKEGIAAGRLGPCRFGKAKDKFYDAYLPGNSVTNSYSTTKHTLITGPNAAGKTTLLKATLFNVILSQQFGYGCYSRATLRPYQHIHCYLNIPDTNGRDSLFQAEARRCKSILDSVSGNGGEERHFCIFDELYSGTNPYEAVGSAVAFLKYLNQHPNVTLLLTTHFIDLCERLDRNSGFRNKHMSVCTNEGDFKYLYKIASGISTIKGGVKVLKELDYPEPMVRAAYAIINQERSRNVRGTFEERSFAEA